MKSIFKNKIAVAQGRVTLNPISEIDSEHNQPTTGDMAKEEAPRGETQELDIHESLQGSQPDNAPIIDAQLIKEHYAKELEAVYEEYRTKGYEEGLKQASIETEEKLEASKKALEEQLQSQVLEIKKTIDSLNAHIVEIDDAKESLLVELVFSSITKIIGHKVDDKNIIRDIVSTNLARCGDSQIVSIHLSPVDIKQLTNTSEDFFYQGIELIEDGQVLPGGCIIKTKMGNLDARLDKQLEAFKKYLINVKNRELED